MDSEASRNVYRDRINRALDFIESNLSGDLQLADVAREACFSPYHFHRIFCAMVGETPDDYIHRLRLEKAAILLWSMYELSVTEIAMQCGFSSPSVFSRNFKARFGSSPRDWKKGRHDAVQYHAQKIVLAESKPYPVGVVSIGIKHEPSRDTVFVRHQGYEDPAILKVYQRFLAWLEAKKLVHGGGVFIGVCPDNFYITGPSKCRVYLCYTLPPAIDAPALAGKTMTVQGGLVASIAFEGDPRYIDSAYQYYYHCWLPNSGFEPDGRPDYMVFGPAVDLSSRIIKTTINIAIKTI